MAHSFSPLDSPSIPSVPHPTPSSVRKPGSHSFNPKLPKPPIHNPFEKFSQNDFDAWIGKLTGDLERALGYEEVDQTQPQVSGSSSDTRAVVEEEEDYLETDSHIEDSFAELKARRAEKGKARDPREGPGLGPKYGDQDQPIEILSEDEADEQEDSHILHSWGSEEEGEEGEEEFDDEGEYDEYDEYEEAEEAAESSARVKEEWSQRKYTTENNLEEEYEEEDEEYEEEYEEEYNQEENDVLRESKRDSAENPINLLSDDETSPGISNRQRDEEAEFLSDDEAEDVRSSPLQPDQDAEVLEDAYKDMQPSDEDTSFPPHALDEGKLINPLVDIRDPWAPVSKYAEDYYAGGEVSRGSKDPLSAHHLSVDDDATGFLSPDVVDNAEFENDEDEERDDESQEYYNDMDQDEPKDHKPQEYNEHEHLFNRLHSHVRHPFNVSYSRGQTQHFGFSPKSGPGTTEEPIMIGSDDEEDEPTLTIPLPREGRTEQKEEERDRHENSDDGNECSEDQEKEGVLFGRRAGAQIVEEGTPEPQARVVEEPQENSALDEVSLQEENQAGVEPNATHFGEEALSILSIHSPQVVHQPDPEPSLLPTPPAEPSEPIKTIPEAKQATEIVSAVYDNFIPSVSNEAQGIQQGNPTVHGSTGDIAQWNIDPSASTTFPLPDEFALTSSVPMTSLSHLDVRNSIPGHQHGLDVTNANIDAQVFAFDDIMNPYAFEQHNAAHAHMEEVAAPQEQIDVGEKEVYELDVEQMSEALPQLTGELMHFDPEANTADGVIQVSNTMSDDVTAAAEGRRTISPEATKISKEVAESDGGAEINIIVEEWEEYQHGTPPEEITIEVHAATPIPPSAELWMDEFKEFPDFEQEQIDETAILEKAEEPLSFSALSSPASPGGMTADEISTTEEPVVVDFVQQNPGPSANQMAEDIDPVETGNRTQDIHFTISVEEDGGDYAHERVSFGPFEHPRYTTEATPTGSDYLPSEAPSRGTSIGMKLQVDEVIPAVTTGDVEEPISGVGPEHEPEASHDDAEGRAEIQNEVPKVADVTNAQWTLNKKIPVESEVHTATGPILDVQEAESYFDQPGTPVTNYAETSMDTYSQTMTSASPSGGGLPTIIQLPGTPQKVLSPGGTPGVGPTPVAIAVDPAVLKALKTNPALFSPPSSLHLPPRSHEDRTLDTSECATPAASSTIEATVTERNTTDILSRTTTPHAEEPRTSTVNHTTQTSFPATTVATKPGLPTLFDDPYPYSLSTPGPQNEERTEEEESTEQEHSLSSTSSIEKSPTSTKNDAILDIVVGTELDYPLEITKPDETAVISSRENDGIVDSALEAEEGLMDVEAEAAKLIDEFLVDEPDSDTDADGEADPEFVGLKIIKERDGEVGTSTPSNTVDVPSGEVESSPEEADENTPNQSEEASDKDNTESSVSVAVSNGPLPEDEQDPFKLMGNDSTVAPGEVPEPTPTPAQEAWDKEREEDEVVAATMPQLQELSTNEPSPSFPTHVTTAPLHPADLPVSLSQIPLVPHTSQPLEFGVTHSHVGQVSYELAAVAHLRARGDSIPVYPLNQDTLLYSPTAPIRSAQALVNHKQPSDPANENAIPSRPIVETSAEVLSREPSSAAPVSSVDSLPHRVHISVENPYHADNDSDYDEGSVSRAKKRKRSHSDDSNAEIPITPAKSNAMSKSKTASTGTRSTAKASRFSRDRSKRRDQQPPQSLTKRNAITKTMSRSPSVPSSILSDGSFLSQPSPTRLRPPSSELRPFLHAHSRRSRGKAPTTIQEQLHKQRPPSLPSASGVRMGILRAEDVLTKAPSVSSANSSSLVTRSHCRYHRISIPKTENGPRINFLVPGCCLNDEDLIHEEEIKDHGVAIIQGDTCIVDDIETLDFEAYLHWVMRQLVGPEILRENEVFYLPEPNEEIVRNPHRPEKRKGGKPEKKRSKLADEATVNSHSGQSPSQSGSVGSSASVPLKHMGSDSEDLSSITETEDDKPSHEAQASTTRGDNDSTVSRKRGRRLGQDAAAYRPSESDEASSADHNSARKGPRNKGQKRPRTSEPNITDALEQRNVKRPKTRPSQSQGQVLLSHNQQPVDQPLPDQQSVS